MPDTHSSKTLKTTALFIKARAIVAPKPRNRKLYPPSSLRFAASTARRDRARLSVERGRPCTRDLAVSIGYVSAQDATPAVPPLTIRARAGLSSRDVAHRGAALSVGGGCCVDTTPAVAAPPAALEADIAAVALLATAVDSGPAVLPGAAADADSNTSGLAVSVAEDAALLVAETEASSQSQ